MSTSNNNSNKNKIVLVTGSNKGIGRAVVEIFAKNGYTVYIGARNKEEGLKARDEISKLNPQSDTRFVHLDIESSQSIKNAVEQLTKEAGYLDILVNNAAVFLPGSGKKPSEHDPEVLKKTFDINFFGTVEVTQLLIPLLRKGQEKVILNVSSDSASLQIQNYVEFSLYKLNYLAYGTSKMALNGFTLMLSKEMGNEGFKVNCIHPGHVLTDMNSKGDIQPDESALSIYKITTRSMVFSFPILSTSEILAFLSGEYGLVHGYRFTEEDITKPQAELWKQVFYNVLELFGIYNKDQPLPFAIKDIMSYPELQEDSANDIIFVKKITRFMRTIGVSDFGSKDIYKPEFPRAKKIISAIINAIKWRDERWGHINKFEDKIKDLQKHQNKCENDESRMENHIELLREKKNDREKQIIRAQQEYGQLETLLLKHNSDQGDLRNYIKKLKIIDEDLGNRINDCTFSTQTIAQECSRIDTMVVKSPERIKKLIEDMEINLKSEKENLVHDREILTRLQSKLNQLEKIGKDMQKTIIQSENILKEHEAFKKKKQESKDLQKKITDNQKVLNDITHKVDKNNNNIQSTQETIEKNQERFKNHKDQWNNTIKEVQAEKVSLQKESEDINDKVRENRRQQDEWAEKIENLKSNYEKDNLALNLSFRSLVDVVYGYHTSLEASLKDPPTKFQ
ncbi:hypothetical protein DLAC_07628 [Tieghemostelium lacteum]|uniref:Uncharacterized protein n=1 Tax=Tieghemostelium lacteum TaxID=361077 RepID=A0A151ZCZ5_TIELA|nr:hypothetical protein DLAC_07628 [Tieghemostelium lacteum]|eukprot:KYQ91828.1 hypothetical protein DLAC_07628 [Tieghemostelium lacteum]